MNRNDKLIVALLFALLMGWLWYSARTTKEMREQQLVQQKQAAAALATNTAATAALPSVPGATNLQAAVTPAPAVEKPVAVHLLPEQTATLHAADMNLLISSRGATLTAATLPAYRARPEKGSGPVVLDFHPQPALALSGLPGMAPDADYAMTADPDGKAVTLACRTAQGLTVERRIELRPRHLVVVSDRIGNASDLPLRLGTNEITLGTIYRGDLKNDEISADSMPAMAGAKVERWNKALPKMFGAGGGFGCNGGGNSQALPETAMRTVEGAQEWVALKSRFFVETVSAPTNAGFRLDAVRDTSQAPLTVSRIAGSVLFPGTLLNAGDSIKRRYTLYVGPKKLAYLSALDVHMDEIMEFGFFSWFCKPLVALLNWFYHLIPNYGVAIILLTLLVRVVFWPLTHKSTESAKRMRDIQPKIKAIQESFKDDPHKLQQETWRVYRENKVNPLSSCLPMLVQIPIFIALYTVLRSAVDLRQAPFLWVHDLSQPENLLAGVLPIPINILPLLMAATTVVQSKLTPSMGDPMQQKMLTWMMPLMMLFFFYSMPAALSLYWTVSTMLAIFQLFTQQRGGLLAMLRRKGAAVTAGTPGAPPADGETMTRQMRRRMGR